jgi:hypothetical protein
MGASPTAAGAGPPAAPSDFTVCFFAQPTDTKAAMDNASTAHFQENVPFILLSSFKV